LDAIVGRHGGLRAVLSQVEIVAPTNATVLISGETGTGKELVAKAIHELSPRRNHNVVKLNCAAIPSGLLESELFGHERGAFTGALMQKKGRFELADGGSLFLDEIGDIPLELQPKLLRAVQEQEFERLGSTHTIHVNVRMIAATHRNLPEMITEGKFREDLFYRLNVVPIRLPPLRERSEDIPALVRHFFALAHGEGLPMKSLDQAAMERLKGHRWPGNVRELENLVRRLAALYSQEVIGLDAVEAELAEAVPAPAAAEPQANEGLGGAAERHLRDYFAAHKGGLPPSGLYDRVLREVEKPLILLTLGATRGNQLKAAQLLGLNRNTLRKKIRELDIDIARSLK
jgi:two-component system nitrogen regulation response regulator GlnG